MEVADRVRKLEGRNLLGSCSECGYEPSVPPRITVSWDDPEMTTRKRVGLARVSLLLLRCIDPDRTRVRSA